MFKSKSIVQLLFLAMLIPLFPLMVSAADICQYATSAVATSENPPSIAANAVGAPDAPYMGQCSIPSSAYTIWSPATWNGMFNLTLHYAIPIWTTNLTVFGDWDICWNAVWLKNNVTHEEIQVFNGINTSCIMDRTLPRGFFADTITLQTCGWSWSTTDAVQLCGTDIPPPICGNGIVEEGEACDDHNTDSGDGCTSACEVEYCGDGIVSGLEECDDKNAINGDGCTDCRVDQGIIDVCAYATFAEATDEQPGFEAIFATGTPDSDQVCSTPPVTNKSWSQSNWDSHSNITLMFPYPVYPGNLTVLGDYDLCINAVWIKRDNSAWYLVSEGSAAGEQENCTVTYNLSSVEAKTSMIRLETCPWAWSSIDAASFCGKRVSSPKITLVSPLQDEIIDASNTTVMLNITTDIPSVCEISYIKEFSFGTGFPLTTSDGLSHTYAYVKPESLDKVEVYYKCRNNQDDITPFGIAHRFSFKNVTQPMLEVCDWYGCAAGSASISMDDQFYAPDGFENTIAICREALESRGLKGTYFLTGTNGFNQSEWNLTQDLYDTGHEIAAHSQRHNCSWAMNEAEFRSEVEGNINDIIGHITMPRDKLISYAWPCGSSPGQYQQWIADYFLISRGYHFNQIESKSPVNYYNLKSINSIGYGVNPPDLFLLADTAENQNSWANYVYHDSCKNNEPLFDYLLTKDIWIDTIGDVSKYTKERNAVEMKNLQNISGGTSFGVSFDLVNPLNTSTFDHQISFRIYLGDAFSPIIKADDIEVPSENLTLAGQRYVTFSIVPSSMTSIEIIGIRVNVPYCGNGKKDQPSEECDDGNTMSGDGCSNECKDESTVERYIMLYVGNIDGSAAPTWYYFYDFLTAYFEQNNVPVGFSFIPATINDNDTYFSSIFRRMYLAQNIKLDQKGYNMNATEEHMDQLSLDEQRAIIKTGRYTFIDKMRRILNDSNVSFPVTYVAPFSRFTTTTRQAVQELGFKTNFGLYYNPDLGPVGSTPTLDSIQYGVSFTVNGDAGADKEFKTPAQIVQEVKAYNRLDLTILTVNGKKVIPLFVHQPDFEQVSLNSQINMTKWGIFNETIQLLMADPTIAFLTPEQAWTMRHPYCMPTGIPETFCNGVDDDCDRIVDEDFTVVNTSAVCGIGACQAIGRMECINGIEMATCQPGIPALNDSGCDGIDDNCNGQVDEEYLITNSTCGTGACTSLGQLQCTQGNINDTCRPGIPALNDSGCDGIDDNCNGQVDEEYLITNSTCGTGACTSLGQLQCT
ncbi:MAG: DUF4215 domain-containing protein, partial [Nanoarchaeota archaeon]